MIKPPRSRIGPVSDAERRETLAASIIAGHYEKQIDRESAYEILKQRAGKAEASTSGGGFDWGQVLPGGGQSGSRRRGGQSVLEAAAKSAARSIGQELGRQIIRGVLGSLLGGRR